jgi:anti-sigma B factor antagonist
MASASDMGRLEVQTQPDRDRVILEVSGELDMASVGFLQAALDEVRESGWESIVLDVRELTFIDSSGLALLLHTDRAARSSGLAFAVVDGSPAFARLLEIVGLQDHFTRAHLP